MEICLICNQGFKNLRSLATHLQYHHKIKSLDYVIKYVYNNKRPLCPICQEETRFFKFKFRKYCKDHAKLAMSEGGIRGGKKEAWNKGKTKQDDPRLLKQAIKATGEGNHFYNKIHSNKSIKQIKASSRLTEQQYHDRLSERCYIPWIHKPELKEEKWYTLVSRYDTYLARKEKLKLVCNSCNKPLEKTFIYIDRGSRCHDCFPPAIRSSEQTQVTDFIKSLGITNIIEKFRK